MLLYSFTTNLRANLKELAKTAPLDIGKAILSNALSSLITNYERQKKEYERILFLRYTNKYNAPYALQREEAVYIPMPIFNAFCSLNLHTLYSGTNLCSGGLGVFPALFALFRDKGGEISQTFLLTKLFAYLCLDELRGGKILKDEKGKYKTIEDDEFFQKVFGSQTSKIEFDSYRLPDEKKENNKIPQQEERRELKNEYMQQQDPTQGNAIDSYEIAMAYLQDIANGIFNTTRENQASSVKHRKFIIALDKIGKNNIKGLYVGMSGKKDVANSGTKVKTKKHFQKEEIKNNQEEQKRPKLIGRLATTIIPKGGLWIG